MDLTEAEAMRKRRQEYTEELYKKDLHDPDNHDGMITDLEPDILEYEVKWALGSLTRNKASGGDGIPAELFQILKRMLWKCCTQYASKSGKLSSGHRTGKGQLPSSPKERQWKRIFKHIFKQKNTMFKHNCTHLTHYQGNAQSSPIQASTICELWTSRCSSWI